MDLRSEKVRKKLKAGPKLSELLSRTLGELTDHLIPLHRVSANSSEVIREIRQVNLSNSRFLELILLRLSLYYYVVRKLTEWLCCTELTFVVIYPGNMPGWPPMLRGSVSKTRSPFQPQLTKILSPDISLKDFILTSEAYQPVPKLVFYQLYSFVPARVNLVERQAGKRNAEMKNSKCTQIQVRHVAYACLEHRV